MFGNFIPDLFKQKSEQEVREGEKSHPTKTRRKQKLPIATSTKQSHGVKLRQ